MIFRIFPSRFHCVQDKRAWNSIPNFSVVIYHVVILVYPTICQSYSHSFSSSFQLQLVLCQSEYFSLKIKSEFGNCTTYQVPITLKNPFSNYESPSIINFTLAVKSFYVSFSTFLAIESTYTALLQIWKKTKTPFVRLILISHVQSIADCCFKFLEVEVNGPKLDSRYLEWVYVNK